MTYVVAWRTHRSVFVSADSVLTIEGGRITPTNSKSTFDESHIHEAEMVVEERMCKIKNIDNKILVALAANDLDLAFEVVRIFEILITGSDISIVTNLENSISMVLSEENRFQIQVVVGTLINDIPTLISYNTDSTGKVRVDEQIVQFGSLVSAKPIIAEMTEKFIHYLLRVSQVDPGLEQHFLIRINTWIQSFGLNNGLLEIGVGGVICGAEVGSTGVRWQKDSVYFLYGGPEIHIQRTQLIICRHNGVLVYNMLHGSRGFFFRVTNEEIEMIREELRKKVNLIDVGKNVEYLVFLCTVDHQASIVTKQANERDSLVLIESPARDGTQLGWFLTPNFVKDLCNPPLQYGNKVYL